MDKPTVVHLFAGSGGCPLGFLRAGFRSLGSFDFDPAACRDLVGLTGGPAFVSDLAAMEPAELRELTGECPDVVVMSPPCKSFSGCMPAKRAKSKRYVDMSQLAVRGMFLALEAWAPKRPRIILLENVPRIANRGRHLLDQVIGLLQRSGYTTDERTHDCGELGGLAQHRRRFLLVARHMEACPDMLRVPPAQRVKAIREVLEVLPSPMADHGDDLHRQPKLSPLNWLRLAAIRPGKDWRDLPSAIHLGGDPTSRKAGKMGVEDWGSPAHTVIGRGSRPGSTWASTADPRVAYDREHHGGRPDAWGVADWDKPSVTVRSQSRVQTSRSSVADPRLGERASRQNGGYGVEDFDAPAHAVLGEGTVRNTRASLADPRLRYSPRAGSLGVMAADAPAPTIRGHHEPSQAPGSVVDERGWPLPTHRLEREGDDLVLYGPPIDITSKRPTILVIRAPDGSWHRPLTDRELATLQGFPVDCHLEGPSSSSKKKTGRREHIGNAIPAPTAEAIAREVRLTLEASDAGEWRLSSGGVWVEEVRP